MTIIVGLRDSRSRVWIGGDSCGDNGYSVAALDTPKVFERGPFLVGYTTSFRFGNLLSSSLIQSAPKQPPDQGALDYMVTSFVDHLREGLKRAGYAKREHDVETGGAMLVGYQGVLYEVAEDYAVVIPRSGYTAIGSGYQFAMGSLYTSEASKLPFAMDNDGLTRWRVEQALHAAHEHCNSIRPPFTVMSKEADPGE